MKAASFLLLIFLTFSCQNDDQNQEVYGDFIWGALLSSEKSENTVNLKIIDPTPFTDYAPPGPATPEYFNVYISDDMETFQLIQKVKVGTTDLEVENLTNDRPYYFYVSSHRDGYETIVSDTLMTIPSAKILATEIPINLSYSIEVPIFSPDNQFVAFSSQYGPSGNVFSPLYLKSLSDPTVKTIDVETFGANWAPTGNALVYIKYEAVGNSLYPKRLMQYDIEQDTSITLQEIDYTKYYISSPQYFVDFETIVFSSSEGNSEIYLDDLWTLNIETKEKTKISDFEKAGVVLSYGYDVSMNGDNIFISGYKTNSETYPTNIYKYETVTGSLTDLLVTRWRDERPTVSPDNSKIAFVSGRSGTSELWVYNLDSQKYSQITGDNQYKFYGPNSYIQWLDENQLIINFYSDGLSKTVKLQIE